jgi:hypothetical protein
MALNEIKISWDIRSSSDLYVKEHGESKVVYVPCRPSVVECLHVSAFQSLVSPDVAVLGREIFRT